GVGGVVALINTHLTGMALAYCINVVSPKHIIVAAELFESFTGAQPHITGDAKIWLHGDANANFPGMDRDLDSLAGDELAAADRPALTIEDRALYIYTSGTTGLPKAANVNHYRVMLASYAFAGVMDTRSSDRMYDCLPLYHTAGGVVATGALLVNGGSVVIRDKFSAREFWDDVVRFDPESQQPIRDEQGFCIECQVDEPGEVIGKIIKHASKPGQRFEGYASQLETDRKILHDVFKKGDLWFRTGDLMRKDKNGYFYFVDRIGDTFRWKGENVSTTEVEEVVGRFDGILETNVYGVQIPGRDGRAGMAAIVAKDNLNLTALRDHIALQLPEYARPLFLRLRKNNDVTTTFKPKKTNLTEEGFDPSRTTDPIYFSDAQRKAFVRVDPALYEEINAGQARL